jgi:hypothetical protein
VLSQHALGQELDALRPLCPGAEGGRSAAADTLPAARESRVGGAEELQAAAASASAPASASASSPAPVPAPASASESASALLLAEGRVSEVQGRLEVAAEEFESKFENLQCEKATLTDEVCYARIVSATAREVIIIVTVLISISMNYEL